MDTKMNHVDLEETCAWAVRRATNASGRHVNQRATAMTATASLPVWKLAMVVAMTQGLA